MEGNKGGRGGGDSWGVVRWMVDEDKTIQDKERKGRDDNARAGGVVSGRKEGGEIKRKGLLQITWVLGVK